MSSLAKCIEIGKFHPIEKEKLQAAAAAYRKEGYNAADANRGSVRDAISDLEADRADIISQIKKQLPEYFKDPIESTVPQPQKQRPPIKPTVGKKPKAEEPTAPPVPEEKEAPEKPIAKQKPGRAWVKGKQTAILSATEIKRGKNKGKYHVVLTKGRDADGNIIPGRKKIVTGKEIIAHPEIAEKGTLYGEVKEGLPGSGGRAVYTDKDIKTEFPEIISDRAGSYKSGVRKIAAPEDAAAFAHLNLAKYPQEHLAVIVLDANNNIMLVHRYSIGTGVASQVDPAVISGNALNTEGAKQIVLAHNHPGGAGKLSDPDKSIFRKIKNLLKGTPVDALDMIAVGDSEYGSYSEGGVGKIPETKPDHDVLVVERVFKKKGTALHKVASSEDVVKVGDSIFQKGGLLLLDSGHRIVGSIELNDYTALRGTVSEEVLRQTDTTNARAIVAYNPAVKLSNTSKDNLKQFANALSFSLLDIIDKGGSAGDYGALPETYGEKFFSTKATKPQDTITKIDLKDIFSGMKYMLTGQDSKGNFWFKPTGRSKVTIFEVDHIEGYLDTSDGQMPVGSYLKDIIEVKTKGAGYTADVETAFHEFTHFIHGAGILSGNDIKAIDRAVQKETGITETITEEQRADFLGKKLAGRHAEKNLRIKRVLGKIADFMNAVYEFVARTRTARGVISEIESGAILKEKEGVPEGINEFAQGVQFSLKKATDKITNNPNFVKWFGDSKAIGTKGDPVIGYHGTSADFFQFNRATDTPYNLGDGIYLTDNKDVASGYGDRVVEVFMSIQNPMRFDAKGKSFNAIADDIRPLLKDLGKWGNDGIIIENVYDAPGGKRKGKKATTYIVDEPTQIKSIYNTGAFSPAVPDIRYQQTAERFYSQVVKTVETKMPAKMQASDIMPWLRKQPGIKAAELEWMDVERMLAGKKVISKDELGEMLKGNRVVVDEVEKGQAFTTPSIDDPFFEELYEKKKSDLEDALYQDIVNERWQTEGEEKPIDWDKIEKDALNQFREDWESGELDPLIKDSLLSMGGSVAESKFSQYQLEGEKENYRELLFKLPNRVLEEQYQEGSISKQEKVAKTFFSSHWPDDPNVFAHARVNERIDAEGNKILFVEEIQSDFAIEHRKQLQNIEKSVTNSFEEIVSNMEKTGILKEVC